MTLIVPSISVASQTQITWASVPNAVRYEVWVDDKWKASLAATATSYFLSHYGLVPDSLHYVRLVAYDATGAYANSATKYFRVPADVTTGSPAPAPTTAVDSKYQRLVFEDTFDGIALDTTKWSVYTSPGNHDSEPGLRLARAVTVQNGKLVITATWDPNASRIAGRYGEVVSGAMSHRTDYTYGRFEVIGRVDNDPTATMSAVALTWPQSGIWPRDGENDWWETLHNPSRRPTHSFFHFLNSIGQPDQVALTYDDIDSTVFHKYTMDWEPDRIRVFVDDVLHGTVTDKRAIPQVPHHVCLQLDAFGRRIIQPVKMEVQSVRIYQT